MKTYQIREFSDRSFPLAIQKQRVESEIVMPEHTHDFIEIIYIQQGSGTNVIDGKPYPIIQGDLYLIPQGSTHSFTSSREMVLFNLMFQPRIIPETFREAMKEFDFHQNLFDTARNSNAKLSLLPPDGDEINHRLVRIQQELFSKKTGYKAVALAELVGLLLVILRIYQTHMPADNIEKDNPRHSLSQIIAFIHKNYEHKITVAELAEQGCLSPNYASEFFRNNTGVSITEYLMRVRVEKARKLLEETEKNITEIAYSVGMEDSSYFSKIFRKTTGLSPRKYRVLKEG